MENIRTSPCVFPCGGPLKRPVCPCSINRQQRLIHLAALAVGMRMFGEGDNSNG